MNTHLSVKLTHFLHILSHSLTHNEINGLVNDYSIILPLQTTTTITSCLYTSSPTHPYFLYNSPNEYPIGHMEYAGWYLICIIELGRLSDLSQVSSAWDNLYAMRRVDITELLWQDTQPFAWN